MKKILFLSAIAVLALSIACNKDNKDKERTEQTILVEAYLIVDNKYIEPISGTEVSTLFLFESDDFDFDSASIRSLYYSDKMKLKDGTEVFPKYTGTCGDGIDTFESVENGEYFIISRSFYGYNYDFNRILFGYRKITVNKNTHNTIQTIVFLESDRGHFVEK